MWVNRSRLKAWKKWNEECRRSRRARKAVRRWSQGTSTKALIKWKSWVSERGRLRVVGARVIGRWRCKALSLCWDYWCMHLARAKRLRQVSRGIILRWTHRELAVCWGRWRREMRRKGIATAALERWVNYYVHTAWEAWNFSHSEARRLKTAAQRAVTRMQNLCSLRAYNKWWEEVCRARKAHRAIARWHKSTLLQAYNRWGAQTLLLRNQRAVMERVLARMGHIQIARAFDQWISGMEVSRRQRLTMERIVLRMKGGCVARYWSSWLAHIVQHKRLRMTCLRVVTRWMNAVLASAWTRWQCRSDEAKRLRALLVKVTLRWAQISLAKVFSKWMEIIWSHPTVLKVRLDLDFDPTLAPQNDKTLIENQLCLDIGSCLGVDAGCVHILSHQKGCMTAVLSQLNSEKFAQDFTEAVHNRERLLLDSPIGRHVIDAGVYGPISRDALAMLIAAKQTDATERMNLEQHKEEKRSARNFQFATHTFMMRSTSRAIWKWAAWARARKHMRTVCTKIVQHVGWHSIRRAWFALVVFTKYMIELKKCITVLDDDSMNEIIESEYRVWENATAWHEEFENQLYLHHIRRRRDLEVADAFRHVPKLQPLAASGASVFSGYHHSIVSPRKATPFLEALASDPMSLVPGVSQQKSSNLYPLLSSADLSPPGVKGSTSRVPGRNGQHTETRCVRLQCLQLDVIDLKLESID